MRSISRFAVDTHMHLTTLYQPGGEKSEQLCREGKWTGLSWEVEPYDNHQLAIYDMDRYGIDMGILLPSMCGSTNEKQAALVDRYPDRFRACCSDQTTALRFIRGELSDWKFQDSLDEVDAALKTGKYVGIGEFAPGLNIYRHGIVPAPSLEERREQWKAICELGVKYDVPIHFHEHILLMRQNVQNWNYLELLEKVCLDNPKAKIVLNHGYKDPDDNGRDPIDNMRDFYAMAAGLKNLYLETGGWCETNFEIAFEQGVRACYLMWGHDYGNVPQYLFRRGIEKYRVDGNVTLMTDAHVWKYRKTDSQFGAQYHDITPIPTYQPDFYGWGLRTIDKVGDWLTQDEINLIMGGTAARLYKLPVSLPRMFPEARPDIFGSDWEKEWYPFLPDNQIQKPEDFKIPPIKMWFNDGFTQND